MFGKEKKTKVHLSYSMRWNRWFAKRNNIYGEIIGSGSTKEAAIKDAEFALKRAASVPPDETVYL